jgi:hypothetical protein
MDRGPSVRRSSFAVPQPKGGAMRISSISMFALAFVVSVATMFAADPPP